MKKRAGTFKTVTLGCRTNQYESQAYAGQLEAMGWTAAKEGEEVDLCIVNTCTVTASADSSSRREIRKLAKLHPNAKIAVTGCYADNHLERVEAMEGVSYVVPNAEKEALLAYLFPEEHLPEFSIRRFEAHTRAFVKIQDGCNSFCTYCIIPYVRGRSKSKRVEEVLSEIEALVANGYKEVVLTGINIGDFDGAPGPGEDPRRLAELIRLADRIEGLERIRVSSIDPDEVDEELAEAILQGKKTCSSMHIVLQAGSNVVLKRMNRKYTRQIFFETVDRLKRADPHFTFTTDLIVGFPGETEEDFQETLDAVEEVGFAKVHVFPFSPRERTRAALYKNRVPEAVVHERKQRLIRAAEKRAYLLRSRFLGETMEVLTERVEEGEGSFGHTGNFLPVRILSNLKPNRLVRVRLTENSPSELIGAVDAS